MTDASKKNKIITAQKELETTLKQFVPHVQAYVLKQNLKGEEAEFFADKILTFAERIKNIPPLYQTDGQGKKAIAQLHYFVASYDALIVEASTEDGSNTAYGWASFGDGFEAGYLPLDEILELVELDLFFEPTPVQDAI